MSNTNTIIYEAALHSRTLPGDAQSRLSTLLRSERRIFKRQLTGYLDEQSAIYTYRELQGESYINRYGHAVLASTGPLLVPLPVSLDVDRLEPEELRTLVEFNYLNYGTMTKSQIGTYEDLQPRTAIDKPTIKLAASVLDKLVGGFQKDAESTSKLHTDTDRLLWQAGIVHERMVHAAINTTTMVN